MIFLYILIASFLTIFLESFFTAFCGFKMIYLFTLAGFKKVDWKYLLIFTVVTSLILDVVYHYILGTNLLLICIPLLIMWGTSFLVPLENSFPSYIVKFVTFLIFYFASYWIPNLLLEGIWKYITWGVIGGIAVKSIISVLICFAFDVIWLGIRSKQENTKLKLK